MKTYKELVSEIYDYPPTTADEKKFISIHKTSVVDYPVKNEHGLPFRDDRIKPPGPHQNKPASYDPPKEPMQVYNKTNEEVVNEGKAEDDAVKDYLTKGGKVTVGKTKNAKGIEYMRGMSRQKGSSAAAKMSYKEEVSLVELLGIDAAQISEDGLFESNDILSLLAVVADTDTTSELFFAESTEGLVIDKEIADLLLSVYNELDEEDQAVFEAALTESNESFDRVVDFCIEALKEEEINEEKHVFHVHMPPHIGREMGIKPDTDDIPNMADRLEPVGEKPKKTRLKITVTAPDRRTATKKAAMHVARNYGTDVEFTYAGRASEGDK